MKYLLLCVKYSFLFLLVISLICVYHILYAFPNNISISASLGLGAVKTPTCNIFNANCLPHEPCTIREDIGGMSGDISVAYKLNKFMNIESGFVFYPTSNYGFNNTIQTGQVSLTFNSIFLLTQTFLPLGNTIKIYALGGIALTHRITEASYKNITTQIMILPGHQTNNILSPALGYGISFKITNYIDMYFNSLYILSRGDIVTDEKALPMLNNLTMGFTVIL